MGKEKKLDECNTTSGKDSESNKKCQSASEEVEKKLKKET